MVAIVAGAQVLNALGLPPLPWVTIVVGVHFLPLARMWSAPSLARVGVALALCVVVELAQLTRLPARVPQLRWVLGTTFAPVDLLWYAVGALGGAGAMVLVGRLRP